MPNVLDDEELFNAIVVGGERSPGVVTLRGHKLACDWDVKQGGAQDGASTTRKGKTPQTFTASFYLVIDPTLGIDEQTDWKDRFLPILRSSFEKGAPLAFDIYHPDLVDVQIKSVVVKEIGGLEHDGKGGATAVVQFLPYAPPKPKPAQKPTSVTSQPKATKPDPNAAAKAQLAALLAEARRP